MRLLALETSSIACSVAVEAASAVYARHEEIERAHTSLILPMVDEALREAGVELVELDAIAFGAGPGSFTGVRIAVAIAQGLGAAADVPLVGVSSLAAVAQALVDPAAGRQVLVAQDARMNEVYVGRYACEAGVVRALLPDALIVPGELPAPDRWVLAGDAWERLGLVGARSGDEYSGVTAPNARHLLPIARELVEAGHAVAAEAAEPCYLRDSVVRKP